MKHTIAWVILLAGAMALAAESGQELYQKALVKERAAGNLEEAIELYQRAAKESAGDRMLAAKSLLAAARCYEKLGKDGATKLYQEVARNYGDLREAATARQRLTALTAPGKPKDDQRGIVVRRIWAEVEPDAGGRPSADGRYFVYKDHKSHGLAIRDLSTGVSRVLVKGLANEEGDARTPIFSPDGKQVAYRWLTQHEASIRIVGVDGSNMRVLRRDPQPLLHTADWSPDGRLLAVVERAGNPGSFNDRTQRTLRIALLSVADGSLRYLKSPEWRPGAAHLGGFSPDGRFLVYSLANSSSSAADGGIYTLTTDGGVETALVQGPSNEAAPVWSPDGKAVVFSSDRSGSKGLWAIRVADGKPQGAPQLLRPNTGDIELLGLSRNGSCFYAASNEQRDVYVAGLDVEKLRLTEPPAKLSERFVGSNWGPAWSPDGKRIAFYRGVDPKTIAVVIRSVASAEERILPRRFEHRVAGLTIGAPIWFADSRSVLVPDLVNNRALFRRMDVETAEEQVVYDGSYPSTYTAAQLSPDGKTLYFGYRTDSEQTLHLMKRNLGSGKEVELYQTKSSGVGLFALTVSPDGARIAFSVNSERGNNHRDLISLSTQGGKPTVLQRGAYRDWVLGIGQWTNNGAHVLIGVRDPGSRSVRLWAVAGNGEKRPLDMSFSFERMSSLSFSPDGRRLAFTGDLMKQELWVIDNLLPEMRAAR
jgi:Tol biopolymer transport system component